MKKRKKPNDNFIKTWNFLLGITAILFSIVGIVMVTIDTRYFQGIQYLITAILFYSVLYLIKKNKINIKKSAFTIFNIGFIFTVVGLSIHIVMWIVGLIFFFKGFLKNKKTK